MTFENNFGTAEVMARSIPEEEKNLDCIEIDSWCDINMWGHE